ncbi:MAG: Gfo/Idh/MocA family oxidoreductase [Anaerolineales bacterium]|nr:Gfo/Idh/MocA family oxidoreductase [Anaerolineales bacterium]
MTRQLRAVLVGCGGISRAWLDAIRDIPELEMVGFVDLNEQAAREKAAQYGWERAMVSAELQSVLEQVHPDVVFDCTVPEAHVSVTIEALTHGCHVLGEKPLADSMDNAHKMVAAAESSGKTYAVIQNRRYDPNIRRLRRFIESGAIGQITTVTSDFYIGAHFGGFRDRMRHVLLLDMAIHTFDAARLISGADPLAVTCTEWNPPGSWYDHDASAIATFEMTDGIVYSYRGSWCSEGLNTTWECSWRIIGAQGSVSWDGSTGFRAQVVEERSGFISKLKDIEVPVDDVALPATGHAGVIRAFVQAAQTGKAPETICSDNIKSLSMVFGAIESAEQGRRVIVSSKEATQ